MRWSLMLMMLTLGACRTPPLDMPVSDVIGAEPDLSPPRDGGTTQVIDLAFKPPKLDLSQPGGGCAALARCLASCVDQNCADTCFSQAPQTAQDQVDQIGQCAFDFCSTAQGNRPARCDQNGDDPPGTMPGTCNLCQENAISALFAIACSPANSPDCNPAQCTMVVKQCLAD